MQSLDDLMMSNEIAIRLGFFVGVFALIALWETLTPRRALTLAKAPRWTANLGLVGLDLLLLRLIFPAAAVGAAFIARENAWGVLNQFAMPYWASLVLAVIALDFTMYAQHVLVHAVPLLWRLHRVHHADLDFDITTGARFHPIEMLLSMCIKLGVVAFIGAPIAAVVVFEVLLNGTAMFNHGNLKIPESLDRVLRWIVVTPDMHRVHHSTAEDEANTNFGFNLPWWDRLFATYRAQPRRGHVEMEIGISTYREPKRCDRLPGMLAMPFQGKVQHYAITRRSG